MDTTTQPRHPWCATPLPGSGRRPTARAQAASRPRHRAAVALLVVVAALAVPHPAEALVPIPPPPVRLPLALIGHTILTVAEEYTQVPLIDKRRLHNEIVLLVNAGLAAL